MGPSAPSRRGQEAAPQDPPGALAVLGDFRLEGADAVEFLFSAQVLDHAHAQAPAVEVAVEIEQVDFQDQVLAAEGGPETEAGGTVVPGSVFQAGADGVNADVPGRR